MSDKAQQPDNLISMSSNSHRLRRELLILLGSVLLVALLIAGGGVLYFTYSSEQQAWQGRDHYPGPGRLHRLHPTRDPPDSGL